MRLTILPTGLLLLSSERQLSVEELAALANALRDPDRVTVIAEPLEVLDLRQGSDSSVTPAWVQRIDERLDALTEGLAALEERGS